MQTDTIRIVATYFIAVLVLVGSFILLVVPSQVPSEQLLPFLTGITGLVLGWAFQKEGASASARQTERAVTLGQGQPAVTTSSTTLP
jgi:hypothetical protein